MSLGKTLEIEHLAINPYQGVSPPVSVVILTHNEEGNIADCLRSCSWCDDVHVIDSGSTDATITIAASMGAAIHRNTFVSFGQQRNWAIDHINSKHLWQFHLDADERFTAELVREMLAELGINGSTSSAACYRVSNRMIFGRRWLRRSADYPAYQVRLVHQMRCRFMDAGHGQRELTRGPVGTLQSPYLHFPFNKGLMGWLKRHNFYSELEASFARNRVAGSYLSRDLFSVDRMRRRRAIKRASYLLPKRAVFRLIYQYLLKRGFTEGLEGWTYCQLLALYESWIELKIRNPNEDYSSHIKQLIAKHRDREIPEADLNTLRSALADFRRDMKKLRTASPQGEGGTKVTWL